MRLTAYQTALATRVLLKERQCWFDQTRAVTSPEVSFMGYINGQRVKIGAGHNEHEAAVNAVDTLYNRELITVLSNWEVEINYLVGRITPMTDVTINWQ